MSYGSSVSDSVTKEDLIEQNEKLKNVIRRLNEENERLIEEARESLNEDLKGQASEVKSQVESAEGTLAKVEEMSKSIEGHLSRIQKAGTVMLFGGIWIATATAGAVLWVQRAGVHPRWAVVGALLVGMVHLGLLGLKIAVEGQ
jgi:2',3'-cyclic-nucleotide 2'-phosphodiesterase (5'-nucleotidase family)